jgi:hypothetical protein
MDGDGEAALRLVALGEVVGVEIVGMGLLFAILFGVDKLEMSSSGAGRFRVGEAVAMMSPTDISIQA